VVPRGSEKTGVAGAKSRVDLRRATVGNMAEAFLCHFGKAFGLAIGWHGCGAAMDRLAGHGAGSKEFSQDTAMVLMG
jgi:hypothetical protein